MASIILRPTGSENGGNNTYTGWGGRTSSTTESEGYTYKNIHTYIDDTTADDDSTYIVTRTDSSNNTSNSSAIFTISGDTNLESNTKISSIEMVVRFQVINYSLITSGGTLYLELLDENSSTISLESIDINSDQEETWTTKTLTITTTKMPKYITLYVLNMTNDSSKYLSVVSVTQLYAIVYYDYYYTTTITQTDGGTISVSPSGSQKSGTVITITATPNSGYALNKYIVNGTNTSTKTFTLSSNTTVSASWLLNLFIQKNSSPQRVKEIYKKINGSWVKQINNIPSLFSTTQKYYYKNKT